MKTSLTDFLANDNTSQLYPCNTAAGQGAPSVANPTATNAPTSATNYIEPRYLQTTGLNATSVSTRLYNLAGIKDTIFSVDKDLYIPTDMYARFTCGVGNQFTFTSTSATDPTAGAAATTLAITVQNMYLFLAVEQNQLIVDSVMHKVLNGGLKMTIPYTTAFRNSSTGTIANIQIPMTQQYGKKLKRMIHTVWNGTEAGNTALDCANANGSKITLYNTYLDQRQLQDFQLSTLNSTTTAVLEDDWRENQKFCWNSVLQNRAMYQLNWFHCDSWVEPGRNYYGDDSNEDDGLAMDSPKLWMIQATTTNATYTHYNFATFVRHIIIDRSGPVYV
jgi:hypothetical protein